MTPSADYLLLVVLVGHWQAMETAADVPLVGGMAVVRCAPERAALRRLMAARPVAWLLFGDDQEEDDIESLRALPGPGVAAPRFAILGRQSDWKSCDRWLRRGCQVYLDADSSVSKVSTMLHVATACDVVIADSCFQAVTDLAERTRLAVKLTGRETAVVRLLAAGLSNRGIASRLSLSEHTVEFHVSNILSKLAVRNRGEAAEHARLLGL